MAEIPLDFLDEFRALKDEVRQLSGRAQMRPAMTQILTGNVTVGEGGRFYVKAPGGASVLYIGDIDPPHPNGTRQTGMILSREDGNIAMTLWAPDGGQQNPIIWDRTGHAILSEDRTTGQGLARPFIGGGAWFGVTEAPQFTTTSTSFTTLMRSPWIKQQPCVAAWFLVRCSDGTTSGEIQLTDDNGTPISPVLPVGAGSFFYGGTSGPVAGDHESQGYLNWRARVLPGSTGNIGVRGLAVYGMPA